MWCWKTRGLVRKSGIHSYAEWDSWSDIEVASFKMYMQASLLIVRGSWRPFYKRNTTGSSGSGWCVGRTMCEEYSAGEGKKRETLSLISTTKGNVLNVFLLTKLTTANLFLLYSSVTLYCCVVSLPPPFFLSCKASLDQLNCNPPSFYLRLCNNHSTFYEFEDWVLWKWLHIVLVFLWLGHFPQPDKP